MATPRKWPRGYYSYVMVDRAGTPIYVGAGKNSRCNPKRKEFGDRVQYVIVYEQLDKSCAFKDEERLISQYGRIDIGTGTLINQTGGRGRKGALTSQERREAMSKAQCGRKWTEARKEAMRVRMLGNTRMLGNKHSEATKAKISASSTGRKLELTPEERHRRSERARLRNIASVGSKRPPVTAEHRRKLSEAQRQHHARRKSGECQSAMAQTARASADG